MWTLVKHQLSYSSLWMVPILVTALLGGAFLTLVLDELDEVRTIWIFLLLGAAILSLLEYMSDQREKRMLLFMPLPITPRQAVAARLVVPLLMQTVVLVSAFVTITLVGNIPIDSELTQALLGFNGFSLLISIGVLVGEDLGSRLAGSKYLYWGFQLLYAWLVFFIIATDSFGILPDLETWGGAALTHGVVAVLALVTFALFPRRPNFLMGTDPCYGTPVDWGKAR